MKHIVMLLLCIMNLVHAEGFTADILVHMQQGLVPIENIEQGDQVVVGCGNPSPLYAITNTIAKSVDRCIAITVKDVVICAAIDQKIYALGKGWVRADGLILSDLLLCEDKKYIEISALEIIDEEQKMYALSVESSHIFCVTKYGIIAHNTEPVGASIATAISFVCPPAGAAVIVGEIVAFGVAGFIGYLIHKKSKQDSNNARHSLYSSGLNICPCGGKPPRHEEDENEHPNGIYEDAGYHHFNSYGRKSACPNNGQSCLDNSFSIGQNRTMRISIEDGKFVILRQHGPRKLHGYIVESWEELLRCGSKTQLIRNAFYKHGLVNKAGKIIKTIV
jgi:hypothetical protein